MGQPRSADLLRKMNAYWRAANYLSVDRSTSTTTRCSKPLKLSHVKLCLLGHWGTTPGLNFLYVHLNRVIKEHDLDMIYIAGPGDGGPGLVANVYLEGTYSEVYPELRLGSPGLNDATLHVLQACFPHRRVLPAGCDAVTVSGRQVQGAVEVTAMQRSAPSTAARRPALAPVADPEVTAVDLVPPVRPVPPGPHAPDEYVWDVTAVDATGQAIVTWTGLRLRDACLVPGHPAPWLLRQRACYVDWCRAIPSF